MWDGSLRDGRYHVFHYTQTMDGLQGLCGVTLTAATCPRNANLLGGCRAKSGTYTLTTWFYKGTRYMTTAQVMTDCGAAYVAPN